jgi:transcriptional regulator with XRE-family HTH domain
VFVLRIKFERTNRGISQQRLAASARLHQPQLAQTENGRLIPTADQLRRLAAVFKVHPDDLLKDVVVLGPRR